MSKCSFFIIPSRVNRSDSSQVDSEAPREVTVTSHVDVSIGYLIDIEIDRGVVYYCAIVLIVLILIQFILLAEVSLSCT